MRSKDTSTHRVVSQTSFGPSLEWEQLPLLGASRRRSRGLGSIFALVRRLARK